MGQLGVGLFVVIWLCSFVSFIVFTKKKRMGNVLCLAIIGVSFLLAGLRSDRFPDYQEYLRIFEEIRDAPLFSDDFFSIHGEIGFKLIVRLLLGIYDSFLLTFLFFSSMTCFVLVKTVRDNSYCLPAVWLVYYSSSFLLKDLTQFRNSLASLLVVRGVLHFAKEKKVKGVIDIIIAAVFFQYLAILAMFSVLPRRVWVLFACLLFSLVGFYFLDFGVLKGYLGEIGYVSQYDGTIYVDPREYRLWPAVIRMAAVLTFGVYLVRRSSDERIKTLLVMIFLALISYVAFSNIPVFSQRIGGYFAAADAFVLAALMPSNRGRLASFGLISYSFAVFVFNMISREHLANGYDWIL